MYQRTEFWCLITNMRSYGNQFGVQPDKDGDFATPPTPKPKHSNHDMHVKASETTESIPTQMRQWHPGRASVMVLYGSAVQMLVSHL